MKRLTSNNTFEMNAVQLALNQVYISDGRAWYRGGTPECDVSVCDLIRAAADTLGVELPMLSDDALSGLMADWLQYGAEEVEGVLGVLYSALCAMAELRAKLCRYEDTGLEPEEILTGKELAEIACAMNLLKEYQNVGTVGHFREFAQAEKDGRLVVLPCKVTDTVYVPETILNRLKFAGEQVASAQIDHVTIGGTTGKPVFDLCTETGGWYYSMEPNQFYLIREEAEVALKKREEADNEAD